MNLKKFVSALVTTFVLISLQASSVFAASPRFVDASAAMASTGAMLNVNFTITGIGKSTIATVFATSYANAEFVCLNSDGSLVDTAQTSGTASSFGSFGPNKNGRISGMLVISPPPPPPLWCKGIFVNSDQYIVLASISYTDIQLSEDSVGTVDVPGTYSRAFYTLP
jgi:hypothetical protein